MKIDDKKIKIIGRWTYFAAGINGALMLSYIETIIEAFRLDSTVDIPRVVSLGLELCSYVVIFIFIASVYKNMKNGKVFTIRIIRLAQLFGVLHIAVALMGRIWLGVDGTQINSAVVVGLLMIIMAQIFRQGLKIEKDEELTV